MSRHKNSKFEKNYFFIIWNTLASVNHLGNCLYEAQEKTRSSQLGIMGHSKKIHGKNESS